MAWDSNEWLTSGQVAKLLAGYTLDDPRPGVDKSVVYRACDRGELIWIRTTGNQRRIRRTSAVALAEKTFKNSSEMRCPDAP